jgi:RimJ/RimL family protein N-acetyltransferase
MNVPVLQTERLILREYRLTDFPAHAALWAHPRTTRDFGVYQYSEEDCWLRFTRNWGQWTLFGYGLWALEHKETCRYAGAVGFLQARRAITVPYREAPEAAWMVAPDLHSQGLAREAVTAALAWADAHIEAPQSWCMINPQNEISQKVAVHFGYVRAEDATYKDKPMLTFVRPRGAGA